VLRIREVDCVGHHGLELVEAGVRMVVITSIGPRIAWFGCDGGENLLYWDAAGSERHGEWRQYGGHRIWVTRPLADETEEVYAPDNARCQIERTADGLSAIAPPNAHAIEKTLTIEVRDGRWLVTHRLRNAGQLLWSGGAWGLTCTRPLAGTRYRIPLGGGSPTWDVATIVVPLQWGGTHSSRLDDAQFAFTRDALEVTPQSDEAKRMVLAPHGTIEMSDARGVFRKTSTFDRDANYPLDTNLAIYLAPRGAMVEMESMSPQRTLHPGAALEHVEVWQLEKI
jgi:hypothetical protein